MSFTVRTLVAGDQAAIARIHRALVGAGPGAPAIDGEVALVGVDPARRVRGYLVGEVRSWEFGSPPAGWIVAIGVDPRAASQGLGRQLLDEAIARFAGRGVGTVRTMVRRDDVAVLRFFRSGHFTAGPYVELELALAENLRESA